jgi:hypothetical protein
MTHDTIFRTTLTQHLPRHQWIPIRDIYTLVERRMPLDAEDRLCSGRVALVPQWHKNVRKVLYALRREGRLLSRSSG